MMNGTDESTKYTTTNIDMISVSDTLSILNAFAMMDQQKIDKSKPIYYYNVSCRLTCPSFL